MYRKSLFTLLIIAAINLNSCDWVRERLGMPTIKDIKARNEQARQDSILRADYLRQEREEQRLLEDSIFDPAMSENEEANRSSLYDDTSARTGGTSVSETAARSASGNAANSFSGNYLAPASSTAGMNRFHVVVGSFQMQRNVNRMVRLLTERGYRPEELLFKNGLMVVSAGSYSSLYDAQAALRHIKSADGSALPHDMYIYDMKQRRHIER